MFCPQCGKLIPDQSLHCPGCAAPLFRAVDPATRAILPETGRSWVVTLVLAIFLPIFGVHRFYTGHTLWGVIHLVTAGGCGVLWLYDLILILFDAYLDADGNPLVK